jgi:hypothetical protein
MTPGPHFDPFLISNVKMDFEGDVGLIIGKWLDVEECSNWKACLWE